GLLAGACLYRLGSAPPDAGVHLLLSGSPIALLHPGIDPVTPALARHLEGPFEPRPLFVGQVRTPFGELARLHETAEEVFPHRVNVDLAAQIDRPKPRLLADRHDPPRLAHFRRSPAEERGGDDIG